MKTTVSIVYILFAFLILGCKSNTSKTTNQDSTVQTKVEDVPFDANVKVEWVFEEKGEGQYGEPLVNLKAKINGKLILIQDQVNQTLYEMEKEGYANDNFPKTALTAVKGWWAGGGSNFYVALEGGKLVFYRGETGEELNPEQTQYKAFKTISSSDLK